MTQLEGGHEAGSVVFACPCPHPIRTPPLMRVALVHYPPTTFDAHSVLPWRLKHATLGSETPGVSLQRTELSLSMLRKPSFLLGRRLPKAGGENPLLVKGWVWAWLDQSWVCLRRERTKEPVWTRNLLLAASHVAPKMHVTRLKHYHPASHLPHY